MNSTSINWTEKTWNPVRGCSKVSPGCAHCYGLAMARRFCNTVNDKPGPYRGLVNPKGEWAGKAVLVPDHLGDPLKLRKPSVIFVNSMSDLFHESLLGRDIGRVFGVMASCPHHFFQVLTKRPERALALLAPGAVGPLKGEADQTAYEIARQRGLTTDPAHEWRGVEFPLRNVAIGVSVEDQYRTHRIDTLKQIPAVFRFVSFEPLLEMIIAREKLRGIALAVMGCESGAQRRHTPNEAFPSLVEQCDATGCLPFVKQLEINGLVETDLRKFPRSLRRREFPPELARIMNARKQTSASASKATR